MGTRDSFVERFGEDQAAHIEAAAREHKNGQHDKPGSDPFRWAIVICIGYQCFEVESHREYHQITAPYDEIKQWAREHGNLAEHDGDCDFLGLFAGAYNEYMPIKETAEAL
jgi:hypothetical protein